MEKKKITIVVPVYNVENYIEKTLQSLCTQTYQNLQILLIDDGSKDRSLSICKKWAEKDARIEVLEQKNSGVAFTRNRGIEAAKGEYVMFMDADDWIEADMLEQLYRLAEKYHADVANCILQEESKEAAEQVQIPRIAEKKKVKITHFDNRTESGLALLAVWGPVCKLFRKSVIEDIRFEDYKVAEDLLFNTNVICSEKFSRVATIYYPFYHYVIYSGSAMKQKFQKKYMDAMYVELECYQKLTAISPKFGDINLIGCSVSRVFEKYAQLSKEEKKLHKKEFRECKKFAKKHKKALLNCSNMHRKISGMLKVYVPDLYLISLSRRYKNVK